MLFTTWTFATFLVIVLSFFYASPLRFRRYVLLIASLLFYASWNVRFVPLLLALIIIDYAAAQWIGRTAGSRHRVALWISIAANLGFLGFFKYTNFVIGVAGFQPFDIVLPLGISFHTFQSISYVVDVYRGQQPVIRRFTDYALFVSFFPQLVAGPIVRAREFFADLFGWRPPSHEEWQRGIILAVIGLSKKLVCADQFAVVAEQYFANSGAHPGFLSAWTGILAFALQIFFDFSGYTDMAIGIALLFGFHFPKNFVRPYLAASITDFWHRWHISLSRWLRDYVYIPLGGNRRGHSRTYANLITTMLLGGLWHGAGWTFVIWGGYHGVLLATERVLQRGFGRVITFLLVCIGWVFFRAPSVSSAVYVLSQMFSQHAGKSLFNPWHWRLAGLTLLIAVAEEYGHTVTDIETSPVWVRTAAVVALLLAVEFFGAVDLTRPFIYFQF